MLSKHENSIRTLTSSGMALLIVMLLSGFVYGANNLQKIRLHLYDESGTPEKVRIALDFLDATVVMKVRASDQPYKNAPDGSIEDIIVSTQDVGLKNLIVDAPVIYKNAGDLLNISVVDHEIHIAIKEEYQLTESIFKYVTETNVAYVDLGIQRRTSKPVAPVEAPDKPPVQAAEPALEAVTEVSEDSLTIEKSSPDTGMIAATQDTVYIEKVIHDTVLVEKIVYVEKGVGANTLSGINCEYYVNWWNDPHFKVDFQFTIRTEKLVIEESNATIANLPAGFTVQHVVYPLDESLSVFRDDLSVNYMRCEDKIRIVNEKNRCYILAADGYNLKPHEFSYDNRNRDVFIRLRH